MLKTVFRVLATLVIGFVFSVSGWIIGALIGGNFAEQFVFNGLQGYEATGQAGFILGALLGLILGWRFLVTRK